MVSCPTHCHIFPPPVLPKVKQELKVAFNVSSSRNFILSNIYRIHISKIWFIFLPAILCDEYLKSSGPFVFIVQIYGYCHGLNFINSDMEPEKWRKFFLPSWNTHGRLSIKLYFNNSFLSNCLPFSNTIAGRRIFIIENYKYFIFSISPNFLYSRISTRQSYRRTNFRFWKLKDILTESI